MAHHRLGLWVRTHDGDLFLSLRAARAPSSAERFAETSHRPAFISFSVCRELDHLRVAQHRLFDGRTGHRRIDVRPARLFVRLRRAPMERQNAAQSSADLDYGRRVFDREWNVDCAQPDGNYTDGRDMDAVRKLFGIPAGIVDFSNADCGAGHLPDVARVGTNIDASRLCIADCDDGISNLQIPRRSRTV